MTHSLKLLPLPVVACGLLVSAICAQSEPITLDDSDVAEATQAEPETADSMWEKAEPVSLRILVDGVEAAADRVILAPAQKRLEIAAILKTAKPERERSTTKVLAERPALLSQTAVASYNWETSAGTITDSGPGRIQWSAGTDGQLANVKVSAMLQDNCIYQDHPEGRQYAPTARKGGGAVQLLPAIPFDRNGDGTIAGVAIGIYPNESNEEAPSTVTNNSRAYRPPESFYRVDGETAKLLLSPHCTLGMLAPSVFEDEEVRFIAFDPRLATLFEAIYSAADQSHIPPESIQVLRGFVSPNERQRLERQGVSLAPFTRYQYGDALALIADKDGDSRMDDLDGDGKVGPGDADKLGAVVEQALTSISLKGGLGIAASFEGPNHIGTPYVHVDLRGWDERWRE